MLTAGVPAPRQGPQLLPVQVSAGEAYLVYTDRLYSRSDFNNYVAAVYKVLGTFLFGAAVSQSLTDLAKYMIGRLRPNFLAVCDPDWSRINCSMYVQVERVCRGNPANVTESRWVLGRSLHSGPCGGAPATDVPTPGGGGAAGGGPSGAECGRWLRKREGEARWGPWAWVLQTVGGVGYGAPLCCLLCSALSQSLMNLSVNCHSNFPFLLFYFVFFF